MDMYETFLHKLSPAFNGNVKEVDLDIFPFGRNLRQLKRALAPMALK
jgi:hypothetical protein